jgi:hypothetical protein
MPMTAHRWAHANRDATASQARRRKYNGREHRAAYADYKRRQARGEWLTCWRTGHLIPPTERCHVGHDDHDVDLIRGPECAEHNVKAAARKGARIANGTRRRRKPRPLSL